MQLYIPNCTEYRNILVMVIKHEVLCREKLSTFDSCGSLTQIFTKNSRTFIWLVETQPGGLTCLTFGRSQVRINVIGEGCKYSVKRDKHRFREQPRPTLYYRSALATRTGQPCPYGVSVLQNFYIHTYRLVDAIECC